MLALLIAYYITPLFARLAFKLHFLDTPGGACKKHKAPTPYLGGVAVFIAFLIPLIVLHATVDYLRSCVVGGFFLFLVGLFDDYKATNPLQKLAGQLIAVMFLLKAGYHLKESFFLSHFLSIPLSCLWLLTIINAFNLVDVMDGQATVLAGCCTIIYLVLALYLAIIPVALLAASLLGALCGFLWYNKPPAQIYLGDAGSLFLGGMIGIFPFLIPWSVFSHYAFLAPILITLIPLAEVASLVIVRTYLRLPFYYGSPHHFCHYLQKKGWKISSILLLCLVLSLLLFVVTILFLQNSFIASALSLVALAIFWIFLVFV